LPKFDRVNTQKRNTFLELLSVTKNLFSNKVKVLKFLLAFLIFASMFIVFNVAFSSNYQVIYYQKAATLICNQMQNELHIVASAVTPANPTQLAKLLFTDANIESSTLVNLESLKAPKSEANLVNSAYAAGTAVILDERQLATYILQNNIGKEMFATSSLAVSAHNLRVYLNELNLTVCSYGQLP
jgi:hypothetical protein